MTRCKGRQGREEQGKAGQGRAGQVRVTRCKARKKEGLGKARNDDKAYVQARQGRGEQGRAAKVCWAGS